MIPDRGGGTWCIGNGQVHDAAQMEWEVCKTLNCMVDPMKVLVVEQDNNERKAERVTALPIENHPSDSRVKLSADGKVQTLSERMGTGGGG